MNNYDFQFLDKEYDSDYVSDSDSNSVSDSDSNSVSDSDLIDFNIGGSKTKAKKRRGKSRALRGSLKNNKLRPIKVSSKKQLYPQIKKKEKEESNTPWFLQSGENRTKTRKKQMGEEKLKGTTIKNSKEKEKNKVKSRDEDNKKKHDFKKNCASADIGRKTIFKCNSNLSSSLNIKNNTNCKRQSKKKYALYSKVCLKKTNRDTTTPLHDIYNPTDESVDISNYYFNYEGNYQI